MNFYIVNTLENSFPRNGPLSISVLKFSVYQAFMAVQSYITVRFGDVDTLSVIS